MTLDAPLVCEVCEEPAVPATHRVLRGCGEGGCCDDEFPACKEHADKEAVNTRWVGWIAVEPLTQEQTQAMIEERRATRTLYPLCPWCKEVFKRPTTGQSLSALLTHQTSQHPKFLPCAEWKEE